MSMYNYLTQSEGNQYYRYDNWVVDYPMASPRIVERIVFKSPYIDKTTKTWWVYNDEQAKYIDTEVLVNIDQNSFNEALKREKISTLINDANYATSAEDEPMTIAEVDNILT